MAYQMFKMFLIYENLGEKIYIQFEPYHFIVQICLNLFYASQNSEL